MTNSLWPSFPSCPEWRILGTLLIAVSLSALQDDYGDTSATVGVLTLDGANHPAVMFPYRDVDLFQMELVAGQTVYFAATDTQNGAADFDLVLLGVDGTTGLHAGARIISRRLPEGSGGTHCLRVEALISYDGSTYLGGYVVRATVVAGLGRLGMGRQGQDRSRAPAPQGSPTGSRTRGREAQIARRSCRFLSYGACDPRSLGIDLIREGILGQIPTKQLPASRPREGGDRTMVGFGKRKGQ